MSLFEPQQISEVILVKPQRFGDDRGFFSETFRENAFREAGICGPFVQDNHSLSVEPGVIRGLHFQTQPSPQSKLVRCTRGRILDVAVDVRRGSPSFGQHVCAELSAENGHQLYIPVGFAHGLCTLEPNCEVQYKVTGYYDPAADKGVLWSDPDIGIKWPLEGREPILSEKDRAQPILADLPDYFPFER
ncbi:MAG: dTDP-4-dehydrorhamnose 3,5-epimerase [Pseudomonadota bacterium]